jgi:hypothetical protein
MNVTDLITDRIHENLNPRDIDTVERYRWLIEMIAVEYAAHKVKNITYEPVLPTAICCNAMCSDTVHKEGSVYCEFHASM